MSDYLTLEQLIQQIPEPDANGCLKLLRENFDKINKAPGSSANHQAWEGGYVDHILEVMNFGCRLYHLMNSLRPLPFSLGDALLVLFLHDIEKPWKYAGVEMATKAERAEFRNRLLHLYGFQA